MPTLMNRWAVAALPVTASLLLAAGAAPAFATEDDSYTPKLRQQLPRTATTDDDGAPQKKFGNCADIPADQDGWHFVLPGNSSDFVKLTVTFKPGGEQVITDFGPPSDKHAYVASEPGATLTSVVAEVKGGDLAKFNLSHTCPAQGTTPEKPGENPDKPGTPGEEPSSDASEPTTEPENPATPGTPGEEPGSDTSEPSTAPSGDTTTQPTDEPASASPSAAAPAPSGGVDGDLAETGSSAPVGMLAAVAAALVAGGGFMLMRRRTARQR